MAKSGVITDFTLLEYPFMHDGTIHEEFEEEQLYFAHHYADYKKGTYVPLWKQKMISQDITKIEKDIK